MKTFLPNRGVAVPFTALVAMLIVAAGFIYALISLSHADDVSRITYRVTPPIFGKAVVVCANLGGLRYFSAAPNGPNGDIAFVRAVCNIGVEVRFQIRYDGKPEGEAK